MSDLYRIPRPERQHGYDERDHALRRAIAANLSLAGVDIADVDVATALNRLVDVTHEKRTGKPVGARGQAP